MSRRQHFHVRSWDGRFYAYCYLGPLRITLLNSGWLFGKRKKRTISAWLWHYILRFAMLGTFIGLPAWFSYYHAHQIFNTLASITKRFL